MPYAAFTPAEFRTWHDAKCLEHSIPRPGRRQSDGSPQVANAWTTSYAKPTHRVTIDGTLYYLVAVPVDDATGLRIVDVDLDDTGELVVTRGGKPGVLSTTDDPATKPKPATVTVDGKTYSTRTGRPVE